MKRLHRYLLLATAIAIFLVMIVPLNTPATNNSPLDDYRAQQQQINSEMQDTLDKIDAAKDQKDSYQSQIESLSAKIQSYQKEADAAQAQIDTANADIAESDTKIADATKRLNERQAALESRLTDIYVYGDITMVDVVLESSSFDDFVVMYDMVQRIMGQDKELLDQISAEKATIQQQKALQEQRRDELVELKSEKESAANELESLQGKKENLLDETKMTIKQLESYYDAMDKAAAEVAAKIRSLTKGSDTLYLGGKFVWPLPSSYTNVTSGYGNRMHPTLHVYKMHTGIDISAPNGISIYAAGAGTVIFAGWLTAYGNAVIIDHGGGVTSLYGHMSRLGTSDGTVVSAGDTIGYVGSTGYSTGNHLHFEVRESGSPVSPWNYLK